MLHFVGTPSLSHPHPLLTPSSYLIVLPFSNFVISVMLCNRNHIAGGFSNWLLSLNIIPWRAIWVVCNTCLFLLLLSRYSILWIYHIFKTSHLLKDFLGVIINWLSVSTPSRALALHVPQNRIFSTLQTRDFPQFSSISLDVHPSRLSFCIHVSVVFKYLNPEEMTSMLSITSWPRLEE